MNKKIIIGNWKMNPETLEEAKSIAAKVRQVSSDLKHMSTVVCPPFVFINSCTPKIGSKNFQIGAQSVSFEENGPFTGQVSASMLKDLGVEYVIVGHSEERLRGDTNGTVSKKIAAILNSGLSPVVCIGEAVRDNETGSHFEFIRNQMKETFADIPKNSASDIIVAYEPLWAIGAKEVMRPELIYEMVLFVKKTFADIFGNDAVKKVRVLYGGSVNSNNAFDIVKTGQVDGLLVGRESVSIVGFTELLKTVDVIEP